MPDWRSMTDAPYLGCYSLEELSKKEIVLTIKSISAGKIVSEGGKSSKKPVATFKEDGQAISANNKVKPMVLNSTNCKILTNLAHSKDTDDWANLRITVFAGKSQFQGKPVDGLQIRPFLADEPKPAARHPEPLKCEDCNKTVTGQGQYSAESIAATAKAKFNRVLCMECAKIEAAKREQSAQDTKEDTSNGESNPEVDS